MLTIKDNMTYQELYKDVCKRLSIASAAEREIISTLEDLQADIFCYSERLKELDSYSSAIDYLDNFAGDY